MPVFQTTNAELIQKCGLDAYFFLRYLRMLLKIFVPAALLIMPILIPINATNPSRDDVKGLDKLMWNNYDPDNTDRLWAHLILAVVLLAWIFYVVRGELRGYIRVRQSYLTSPQHRLRASATTVLVTSIPRKWLTYEALNGLYDVMPGGIRNIWINRDFDELDQKIQLRDNLAKKLEGAETNLIRNAKRKQLELKAKAEKARKKGKKVDEEEEEPVVDETNPNIVIANVDGPRRSDTNLDSTPTTGGLGKDFEKPVAGEAQERQRVQNEIASGLDKPKIDADKSHREHVSLDIATPTSTIAPSEAPINQPNRTEIASSGPRAAAHWAQVNAVPQRGRSLKFWQGDSHGIRIPSPEPHRIVTDDNANDASATQQSADGEKRAVAENNEIASSKILGTITGKNSKAIQEGEEYYGEYCDETYSDDQGFEKQPSWQKYLTFKDRDSMRLPLWGQSWLPFMPSWLGLGKKVDTIYYCRKEVARLNLEIEQDQQEPEKYPLMNSAFIQFNHQVAAHMACQCVSHHAPHAMAPRVVEISPGDVIWENLSIKWWERYIRVVSWTLPR